MRFLPFQWYLYVVKHPKVLNASVKNRINITFRAQAGFDKLLNFFRQREKKRLEKKLADSPGGWLIVAPVTPVVVVTNVRNKTEEIPTKKVIEKEGIPMGFWVIAGIVILIWLWKWSWS